MTNVMFPFERHDYFCNSMVRRFIGIVMVCFFFIPIGLKSGIYVSFKINQDFIAAELCENKEKPEMKCHGKCYLAKQIQRVDNNEKEEKTPQTILQLPSILLFYQELGISAVTSSIVDKITGKQYYNQQFNTSISHVNAVFHPPECTDSFQSIEKVV